MIEFDVNGYNSHECYIHNHGYYLGQQSQQVKIDDSENTRAVLYRENMDLREKNIDLQSKIDELNEVVNGWKDEYRIMTLRYERSKKQIDELQARIDEALEKCYIGIRKQGGDHYLELVEDILKGNKDETIT